LNWSTRARIASGFMRPVCRNPDVPIEPLVLGAETWQYATMNNLIPAQANLTQLDDAEESSPGAASLEPGTPAGGERRLDRRGILQFGGVAALAGAAAVVMGSSAAGAATPPGVMHYAANNDAGDASTGLSSSNAKFSLHVRNSGLGHGIVGEAVNADANGFGVVGTGISGAGVVGGTKGDGPGVRAYVQPGARGSALQAVTLEPNCSSPTVMALQGGVGHGVYSHIENANNASRAVYARTIGTGHALLALVVNAQSRTSAVRASTQGSGAGLEALSSKGVGATFTGKTAQVQLVPSSDAAHPASGTAGQLFVDRSNRLWFCRGGTDWQQLA
jgi:hypothetical protein